ncbi:MAG: thiamine pyrophosphate-binding protein, partial [Planctomycetes bacterium]|nr:thiamine pyrophosphate-binding protein [Planctomycetota bacterium]
PGPVLLDVPKDVAAAPAEPAMARAFRVPAGLERSPDESALEEAAALLRQAQRPVLLAGGGVVRARATAALLEIAGVLRAPVTTTLMALGVVPTDHELFLGMPGMHGTRCANTALHEADVVFAVGARFDDRVTGRADRFSPRSKRIHLDVDASEHGKIVRADLCLHGKAAAALTRLTRNLAGHVPRTAAWLAKLGALPRSAPMVGAGNGLDPRAVFDAVNELAPPGTLFVSDVGQHQMWAAQNLRLEEPGQFVTSGGLGAMGFGVPAALGARLAAPQRPVVAIVGDGGFQMTCHELSTMARYGVQVVVLVLDNQCLGMVRQWQQLFHGRRYSEVDLSDNPDFAALARSLGAHGETVDSAPRLREAFALALQRPGPTVLHVPVHREGNVFPIVPPGQPANVMLDREDQP